MKQLTQQPTELAQTIPSGNQQIDIAASYGRQGDTMMAHVTPGDYVIPKNLLVQYPEFLVKLKKAMEEQGQDYRSHMVGSGFENINPETGAPEFFGGKIGKAIGGVFRSAPVVAPVVSKVASVMDVAAKPLGINFYKGISEGATPQASQTFTNPETPKYTPSTMNLPSSLQELGGLSEQQRRSYLASQGVQGEGLGGSSKDYYINLLQRNIQSNPDQELLPVENQYLRQGGIDTNLRGQSLIDALRGF